MIFVTLSGVLEAKQGTPLRLSVSVSDINPPPSLMCLTSNAALSHTHRNSEWGTTAGYRHRTELSCHAHTAELTHCAHRHTHAHMHAVKLKHTHECTRPDASRWWCVCTSRRWFPHARKGSLDLHDVLIFFNVFPSFRAQVCRTSLDFLSLTDDATTCWIPKGLQLPLSDRDTQP